MISGLHHPQYQAAKWECIEHAIETMGAPSQNSLTLQREGSTFLRTSRFFQTGRGPTCIRTLKHSFYPNQANTLQGSSVSELAFFRSKTLKHRATTRHKNAHLPCKRGSSEQDQPRFNFLLSCHSSACMRVWLQGTWWVHALQDFPKRTPK